MKTIILPVAVIAAIAAAFVLSALSPELRAQDAKAKPTVSGLQWDYRALRIDDRQRSGGRESDIPARRSASQETLNQLGADGWELVAVRTDPTANNNTVFYFKRPKR
jgi:hypothetical protein